MEILFGSDGHIQQALVVQGLGFGLDEEAARAAREIAFTPARLDKQPVSVWGGVINFRFKISSDAEPRETSGVRLGISRLIQDRSVSFNTKPAAARIVCCARRAALS